MHQVLALVSLAFIFCCSWSRIQKPKGNWTYRLRQMITLGIVMYAANQTPGVDYVCHIGGALGGIVCGFTFIRFSDLRVPFNWKDAVIAAFFALLSFAALVVEIQTVGQNKELPALLLTREALTMIDQQNLNGAAFKLDEAKQLAPNNHTDPATACRGDR